MPNIIQADRDAAANSMAKLVEYAWNDRTIELVRSGQRDDIHLVQDFANHRISTSPNIPEVGEDVEARARALLEAKLRELGFDADADALYAARKSVAIIDKEAALNAIAAALSTLPLGYKDGLEAAAKVEQYCTSCDCASCDRRRQQMEIESTLAQDENSRCWSCSCGWVGCYTQAELVEYGEPSECQKCYRERLVECDQPTIRSLSDNRHG